MKYKNEHLKFKMKNSATRPNDNLSTIYGFHAIKKLLQSEKHTTIEKICLLQGRQDQRSHEILSLVNKHNVALELCSRAVLDQLTHFAKHQGFVAIVVGDNDHEVLSDSKENDLESLVRKVAAKAFFLVLDGVQDPHNLGACLRTASAAGVHAVIVPKDNAVGLTDTVRKVACGAAESTPLFVVTNLARTLRMLKEHGVWLYGMAAEAEQNIFKVKLTPPLALVMGAEEKGLRRLTRELCDYLVNIPMRGTVESLNVSVATGVGLFEVVRNIKLKN